VAIRSGLPCEAVRSERPSGEGGSAGKRGVMARGAYMRGHSLRWEAFVNGEIFMRREITAGVFAGRFLSPVFTRDEHCPGHPHICHHAKLERNRTIRGRVITI